MNKVNELPEQRNRFVYETELCGFASKMPTSEKYVRRKQPPESVEKHDEEKYLVAS